ncbi:MAG: ABC transporter permease [Alphaproteobacteria bacterium]|nr:ABC transporter permease [Alphaproteobacteria bacterium]
MDRPAPAAASGTAVRAAGRRLPRLLGGDAISSVALVLMAGAVLLAVAAPFVCPQDPYDLAQIDILDSFVPPFSRSGAGMLYLFGTDDQGRDIFSAIAFGLRISLAVALTATLGAVAIGTSIGLAAAYFGDPLDSLLMRIADMQLAFPAVLIALMLLALLGSGSDKVVVAIMAVQWAAYARTVRSVALVEQGKEYVEAARCLGYSTMRVLFVHILPNCLAALSVVVIVQIAAAVLIEATLSFLGLGVPITSPSLGMLIANGYPFMLSGRFWMTIYPGLTLVLLIFSMNALGERLRSAANPRERR